MQPTITLLRKATGLTQGFWMISMGTEEVGLIARYQSGFGYRAPWSAYKGVGCEAVLIGDFFDKDGGKEAAIAAILA